MYQSDIGRWAVVDPMIEKFFPLTGYSYSANNPVLLNDPTGKDWTMSMTEDNQGRRSYSIQFTGAVLNSSKNKEIDMGKLAIGMMQELTKMFDQTVGREDGTVDFTVSFQASIRVIQNKDELADNEHLIDVKDRDHEDFNGTADNVIGVAKNGKEISLNERALTEKDLGYQVAYSHEPGHTAGLRHPEHDKNCYLGCFVRWGDGPTVNSPKSNFMRTMNIENFSNPTGPTREQMDRMYRLYQAGKLNRKDVQPISEN